MRLRKEESLQKHHHQENLFCKKHRHQENLPCKKHRLQEDLSFDLCQENFTCRKYRHEENLLCKKRRHQENLPYQMHRHTVIAIRRASSPRKPHFSRKTVTMRTFFARNIVTMKTCLPWRSPCVVAGVLGRRGFPPETVAAVGTHNATDTTVVGDSRRDNPTPGADRHDGVALTEETRRQARTYTELCGESGRMKLVVLAGGRCSVHAMTC